MLHTIPSEIILLILSFYDSKHLPTCVKSRFGFLSFDSIKTPHCFFQHLSLTFYSFKRWNDIMSSSILPHYLNGSIHFDQFNQLKFHKSIDASSKINIRVSTDKEDKPIIEHISPIQIQKHFHGEWLLKLVINCEQDNISDTMKSLCIVLDDQKNSKSIFLRLCFSYTQPNHFIEHFQMLKEHYGDNTTKWTKYCNFEFMWSAANLKSSDKAIDKIVQLKHLVKSIILVDVFHSGDGLLEIINNNQSVTNMEFTITNSHYAKENNGKMIKFYENFVHSKQFTSMNNLKKLFCNNNLCFPSHDNTPQEQETRLFENGSYHIPSMDEILCKRKEIEYNRKFTHFIHHALSLSKVRSVHFNNSLSMDYGHLLTRRLGNNKSRLRFINHVPISLKLLFDKKDNSPVCRIDIRFYNLPLLISSLLGVANFQTINILIIVPMLDEPKLEQVLTWLKSLQVKYQCHHAWIIEDLSFIKITFAE